MEQEVRSALDQLYLHQALGFSAEAVESFTDVEMQHMANLLVAQYFDAEFDEAVRFVVACHMVEHYGGTDKQQESLRQDRET